MKTFNIKFSDIEWGEDEARSDPSLENYFVEFPGYEKIWSGKKRYIIGRKGTGKSAILQKIRLTAQQDPEIFYRDISLRDFPLTDFKSMGDRSLQNKSKYVSAWKFLLFTEVAQMMTEDNSINGRDEVCELKRFLDENFPDDISVPYTIARMKKRQNKVSFTSRFMSADRMGEDSREVSSDIHYNKAVRHLEKLFQMVQTESQFILLIDELDEGYTEKNKNLALVILALLRAVDELFQFFEKCGISCIPVLALRSDIFDNLEDNDLNKLDDYILRLNWTIDEEDRWSLKQIAEKRIEATVKEKYPTLKISDYWSLITEDSPSESKRLWKDLCVLTHSRPRDIIKLLKYCSSVVRGDKLTASDVRLAENEYSRWFYNEFRDEAQSFFPCWKEALNCITEVGKRQGEVEVLRKRFDENEGIQAWYKEAKKTSTDIMKILFEYSVIGCVNKSGRWIFKYKDGDLAYMESYPKYCVHYGFSQKLRVKK